MATASFKKVEDGDDNHESSEADLKEYQEYIAGSSVEGVSV